MVLGLHAVWRELLLQQILTGVDGACRRRICELSRAAIRVCWMYRTRPPVTAVRLSCECGIAGPRVVVSCAVAAPGAVTEGTDSCGYCSDSWCAAALMLRGCAPNQSLPLIHLISF